MRVILVIVVMFVIGCSQAKEIDTILQANREAPLGWMYLRIYNDNTFEFESRGLERKGQIYSGNVDYSEDTLFFSYSDIVPRAGDKV